MKKSELRALVQEQVRKVLKEAKEYSFTLDYNTDPDDIEYIENLLKKARVNAYAEKGTFDDEMVVIAGDAIELRKAKKAIEADGFQINEDILNAPGQKQWDAKFKINYDDLPANLDLRTPSLNKLFQGIPYQHVAYPTLSDDGNFLFKNAQDLAKAKQALGMNESVVTEANELTSYKIGDEVKFSNGEVWKVAKPGVKGDKIFLAPFNSIAKKGHISLAIEFTQDELKDTVAESVLKEALIGPFAISASTPNDELLAMYHGALDGFANYKTGMKFKKSEYKLAYQTIEKILNKKGVAITEADDPEAGEAAPYGSGYAEVNEDAGMVVDVAMGVAVGLMGLWALVQSAPLVGRVFGDAAEYLAAKSEKKAKMALKNQRKETIAPIIAKFKNDTQLADMYQSLTPYSAAAKLGSSQAGLKAQQGRVNQLTKIGKYIKSKLTPEEMQYFTDISSMLRTGDLK